MLARRRRATLACPLPARDQNEGYLPLALLRWYNRCKSPANKKHDELAKPQGWVSGIFAIFQPDFPTHLLPPRLLLPNRSAEFLSVITGKTRQTTRMGGRLAYTYEVYVASHT